MVETSAQKAYKVLRVTSLSRQGDAGGIEKYYRIQYRTKGGTVDSVDIAEQDYTEEKVIATLTDLAKKHDKILAL